MPYSNDLLIELTNKAAPAALLDTLTAQAHHNGGSVELDRTAGRVTFLQGPGLLDPGPGGRLIVRDRGELAVQERLNVAANEQAVAVTLESISGEPQRFLVEVFKD